MPFLAMILILLTACSFNVTEGYETGLNGDEKYTNEEIMDKMQSSLTSEREHLYEEVHTFMRKKYNEPSNKEEEIASKIAEVTSEKFGITTTEANEIYLNMEESLSQ